MPNPKTPANMPPNLIVGKAEVAMALPGGRRRRPAPHVILRGHTTAVSAAQFLNHASDPHRYLITGDESATIRLWDTLHEECMTVRTSNDNTPILSIIQDRHDTSRVLVQHKSGRLCSLDLSYNPFAADENVWHVADQPRTIAWGDRDGVLGETFCRIAYVARGVFAGAGRDDGETVVVQDERVASGVVHSLRAKKDMGIVMCVGAVDNNGGGVAPSLRRIIVGYENGSVALWDVRAGRMITHSPVGKDTVLSVAASPKGRVAVACGAFDRIAGVADLEADHVHVVEEARLKESGVGHIVWSADGRLIASAGWDGAVRIWDGRRRKGVLLQSVTSLRWHEGSVGCVSISGDGEMVASGGKDGTVALWTSL